MEKHLLKKDIVSKLQKVDNTLSTTKAKKIIDAFFGHMSQELVSGSRVEIRGLASIGTKILKNITSRNPRSNTRITIPQKRTVTFKASRQLLKELK